MKLYLHVHDAFLTVCIVPLAPLATVRGLRKKKNDRIIRQLDCIMGLSSKDLATRVPHVFEGTITLAVVYDGRLIIVTLSSFRLFISEGV